jgi:hypothetical protein
MYTKELPAICCSKINVSSNQVNLAAWLDWKKTDLDQNCLKIFWLMGGAWKAKEKM